MSAFAAAYGGFPKTAVIALAIKPLCKGLTEESCAVFWGALTIKEKAYNAKYGKFSHGEALMVRKFITISAYK